MKKINIPGGAIGLDYFFVNEEFKDNVKASYIKSDVMGSDHCPIALEIEI